MLKKAIVFSVVLVSFCIASIDSLTVDIKKQLDYYTTEYKKGVEQMNTLQQQLTQTQQMVLRIEGAIQVLQEMIEKQKPKEKGK